MAFAFYGLVAIINFICYNGNSNSLGLSSSKN